MLQPAPEDWCRDYLRLAVQHPLEHERVAASDRDGDADAGVRGGAARRSPSSALQGYVWLRAGQWLQLFGLALAAGASARLGGCRCCAACFSRRVYDMELVREKVTPRRLPRRAAAGGVRAGSDTPRRQSKAQLDRVAAAYRRYNLAAANGFVAAPARRSASRDSAPPAWLGTAQAPGHPDHARARRPVASAARGGRRRAARTHHRQTLAADAARRSPTAAASACRATRAARCRSRCRPTCCGRHLLLVAKTRRGKSTLMLRLAHHAMQSQPRRAVLLVDPHRDLAEAALGLVPRRARRGRGVPGRRRPRRGRSGSTCWTPGLGWDRDRAVANALAVFQREWGERFWGPRMEDAFRFALLTLFDANVALCAADPVGGRAAQHTLLEVPTILSDISFRRQVLSTVTDPSVRGLVVRLLRAARSPASSWRSSTRC